MVALDKANAPDGCPVRFLFEAFTTGHAGVSNERCKALFVLENDAIGAERRSDLRNRDKLWHRWARRDRAVGTLHGALLPQKFAEQFDSDTGKNCFVDQTDMRAADEIRVDLHTAFQKFQSCGVVLGEE